MLPEVTAQIGVLQTGAQALGITLSEQQIGRFLHYAQRLHDASQLLNLTAVPPEHTLVRHFLDSLTLVTVWQPYQDERILDVGTGAGFPGLPLKVAFPQVRLALLDSRHDPFLFLRPLCEELGISDVEFIHARAEEAAHQPQWREQFDMVTARAVAHLWALAEWTLPFVRVGGSAVWMKRPTQRVEVAQARAHIVELGGGETQIVEVGVPYSDIANLLVCVRKVTSTPSPYPRAAARVLREAKRFKRADGDGESG